MNSKMIFYALFLVFISCGNDPDEVIEPFNFVDIEVDGKSGSFIFDDVSLNPSIIINFSTGVNETSAEENIFLKDNRGSVDINLIIENDNQTIVVETQNEIDYLGKFTLSISDALVSVQDTPLNSSINVTLTTKIDSTPKKDEISNDDLLTLVQQQTFKYFWDFGHPVSGLARERNTSGETVTSGGSGFGLMAILVGIEREFITREQGVERLTTIIEFLDNKAERFHGAWSHWLNGSTGKAIAFSQYDDGGDLVETSFMAMGLISVKEYLNPDIESEKNLIDKIDQIWQAIEWDWYTKNGENELYWHWSPNYEWHMNMPIKGYNEALITHVLAASSPTHSVNKEVYHSGWAKDGGIVNGKKFYDIELPLGYDYGGPLFFAHYSFMTLNPTNLSDNYANYWQQNKNHTLINRQHCINNPKNYLAYSKDCWGLTASDNHQGYSAHSPTNDLGVITPTAALSSFPYAPEESMEALRFFYYTLGDRLWGEYGFYDAFNPSEGWWGKSYLAIDQGPIIVMIENYRTGLCWDLFMQNEDIQEGLTKLGFTY